MLNGLEVPRIHVIAADSGDSAVEDNRLDHISPPKPEKLRQLQLPPSIRGHRVPADSTKKLARPRKSPSKRKAPQALAKAPITPAPRPIQKRPNEPRAVQKFGNGKFQARLPHGLVVRKDPDHVIMANIIRGRRSTAARPTQLEVDERKRSRANLFHARKSLLDSLYSRDEVERRMRLFEANSLEESGLLHGTTQPTAALLPPPQPSRKPVRKKARPNQIDLEAPQYRHANDPLPQRPLSEAKQVPKKRLDGRLLGLGPYGTDYTHHFEIFPLEFGVYFHQSTLLGSGIVEACHGGNPKRTVTVLKRAAFDLDGESLHWGPFDAKVFSELGIALDFVADQLEAIFECGSFQNTWKLVNAATFLLNYFQDSAISYEKDVVKSLAARTGECLLSFDERIRLQTQRIIREHEECQDVLRIYDRLLLVALIVFTACRRLPTLEIERFQIEDCLQKLCQTMLSLLFGLGTGHLRRWYEECSQIRYRQRGLRNDAQVIHSWVLVMRTLEVAQIPQVSFWDLVQAELASPQVLSSCDARELESSWEALFTLLPLTEFDNLGILIHGRRHKVSSDGWRIPQRLLKRVFQLYEENNRQLPSFNSYCRALIGRCHHIVQHWGWRRSTLAAGAIFDFFAQQKLIGLRNEEIHGSPRFLEDLNGRPNLEIEASDHCFHVFLKLVALSIHKLSKVGASKDILNLSTRVMPIHDRQYLKDEAFRARDLMGLRNHHDLLCTLFWACPPELRPSVRIMEGLVVPTESHKEACLVNISCWNRISQFLVVSGEACRSFEPFRQWRNTFFSKTLQQVDAVSKDVQKQLQSLNRKVSRSIGHDLVRMTISSNEAAVSEVLQAIATASLDVIKRAPDLEAAAVVFNTPQLQSVFQRFSSVTPKLGWGLLSVCLETLETYLERVDGSRNAEESQGSDEHISDSVLTIDRDLEDGFFAMARCVLSCRGNTGAKPIRIRCYERIVTLAARIGVDYINADAWRLSDLFKGGKYGLFKGPVHKLTLEQRRMVPLLMASLLKHGLDHPSAVDMNLLDFWILSIVKPQEFCSYEMQFARELIRHGKTFVSSAARDLAVEGDYGTNKDLFKFAMAAMRRMVRRADPSSRKSLVMEHSRLLKQVMEQIKNDLITLSASVAASHRSFVSFVQKIMSLIKAHGSDVCGVDGFFLQFTKAYWPSARDPNLRLAGLISYGLRLEEGDGRSVPELFYLLLNNVKTAIATNKMKEQIAMLRCGMKNAGIIEFVLGRMVPVVIRCCYRNSTAFPMLDVYAETLRLVLAAKAAPKELDENHLAHFNRIIGATVEGMARMARSSEAMTVPQLHVVRQSMALLNLFWPMLYTVRTSGMPAMRRDMAESLLYLRDFASPRRTPLEVSRAGVVLATEIFAGVRNRQPQELDFGVEADTFTDTLTRDVDKNWLYRGGGMSIQLAGNRTRSEVRMQMERWDARSVVKDLESRMKEWNWWSDKMGTAMASSFRLPDESTLSSVIQSFPGREQQIRSLATLVHPDAAPCRNLIIHGTEATGKTAVATQLLARLAEEEAELKYAIVRADQCVTGRHLLETIVGAVSDALRGDDDGDDEGGGVEDRKYTTMDETANLWTRFCAAVHDALIRPASRSLPAMKSACQALWPRFVAPVVEGQLTATDFSKLLVKARAHFQDETLLNPSLIAHGNHSDETVVAHRAPADLVGLLPLSARLLLLCAYVASHNAPRHDLSLFSTHHHSRRRRRAPSSTPRSKHRKIARKLLGAHAFVLERMLAMLEAVRSEWEPAGCAVVPAGLDGDVGTALATLASLRLLVRVGSGDVTDRSGKWRINVGWEAVRAIGRSIGVEVEDWLIE
ncbi:hypothetical protein CDD80_2111 [Ophiocordyceps camponoti-rufipedis]|uniref:Uncharacterized protein n=1 Tax=Ophiocordyceps camponoti-rufipedis TaxID=2004952 RepID=A0A2C5ZM95_9HYPO|nr:hypothetical protein CDD80_2111 [Ophiocordyceps camponoti-rufipedis]